VPTEPTRETAPVTVTGTDAPLVAGTALPAGGRVETVAGAGPAVAVSARRSRRGYRLLVRCPGARARGCRGRVTLAARPRAAGGGTVRLGSAALSVRAGASARVEVRVAASRMRRARALERWRLVAVVVLRDPASLAETSWSRRT
jgi:hypothetical protein